MQDNTEVRFANLEFNQEDVEWADVVALGGGGVLYDSSFENVENYLRFIDHAKLMGKKTAAIGMGVQGIYTKYGRRRYAETLSGLDLLIVRDMRDAESLSDIGVTCPIHTVPDLAFLLPDVLDRMRENYNYTTPRSIETLNAIKTDNRKIVGVSLAAEDGRTLVDTDKTRKGTQNYKKRTKNIKTLLKTLARDEGCYIVLFQQSNDDESFYHELVDFIGPEGITLIKPDGPSDAMAIIDLYSKFDAVITSRYHGFIASILAEKPVYILTGSNSGKTERLIDERFASIQKKVLDVDSIDSIDIKFTTTKEQADERNTSIVLARQTVDYVKSLLVSE